jgi:hypothetical protein
MLWQKDSVDGTSGLLSSDDARAALTTYRTEGGEGPLYLGIRDRDGNLFQLSFTLISEASEQALLGELAVWDHDTVPLVAHLGRAAVFAEARVFAAAADECEAALAVAPESPDLVMNAIEAHRRTGNRERVEELLRRLPSKPNTQ